MWTSAELKERAKGALTGSYWKAFGISLILTIISGRGGGSPNSFNWRSDTRPEDFFSGNLDSAEIFGFLALFFGIFMFVLVLALAFGAFIANPLTVGVRKYFVESAELGGSPDTAPFNLLAHAFKGQHYIEVVKPMFLRDVYIFLWSLLLIIPGIIKSYAYAMVPYILSDNPQIGTKRAIELSNEMTRGEKMDMFVLDLSFIGWYLLGLLACFIGIFFVNPYYNATHAELYRVLREKAFDDNLCSYEELGFASPEAEVADDIRY